MAREQIPSAIPRPPGLTFQLAIDFAPGASLRTFVQLYLVFQGDKGYTVEMANKKSVNLLIVGWREWISLPDLGVDRIKAKIDTGARSSSLHAFDVTTYHKNGVEMVRFKVKPLQRDNSSAIEVESPIVDRRNVRSSTGKASLRIVIRTQMRISGKTWPIDLTLANRDEMGFRMLLGREALRNRLVVDVGKSFIGEAKSTSSVQKKPRKN